MDLTWQNLNTQSISVFLVVKSILSVNVESYGDLPYFTDTTNSERYIITIAG